MKKYLIGFIIGAVLMSSTGVFAAVGDSVQATFSSYIFKVNGEEQTLDADPLTYQGTTYLPVRTVANILGYDVVYKADDLSIEFNKDEPVVTEPVITPEPSQEPTEPATSPEPSSEPTESGASTTPEASPSPEPTSSPEPSPEASAEPSPSPSEEVTVEPDNAAACKAINDDYTMRIWNAQTVGDNPKLVEYNIRLLENARDAALADAGC